VTACDDGTVGNHGFYHIFVWTHAIAPWVYDHPACSVCHLPVHASHWASMHAACHCNRKVRSMVSCLHLCISTQSWYYLTLATTGCSSVNTTHPPGETTSCLVSTTWWASVVMRSIIR
jgi:hypothetical protein